MSSDFLLVLGAGAIGSVATAIIAFGARLSAVPAEIERHDAQLEALRAGLTLWLLDAHRQLEREIQRITQKMNRDGLLHSGQRAHAIAEAKTEALGRLRDREVRHTQAIAEIQAVERWPHDLWRRVSWKRRKIETGEPPWLPRLHAAWSRPVVGIGGGPMQVSDPASDEIPMFEALQDHAPGHDPEQEMERGLDGAST